MSYEKRPAAVPTSNSRRLAEQAKREQLLRECPELSKPIDSELKGRISVQRWSFLKP